MLLEKNKMTSYKFNGRDINLKSFTTVQEFISNISSQRVVLSVPVMCNKKMNVILLDMKQWMVFLCSIPNKLSFKWSLSRYNENSTGKMGLDISRDKKWMKMSITLWKEVEKQCFKFSVSWKNVVTSNACTNPKRMTWKKNLKHTFME